MVALINVDVASSEVSFLAVLDNFDNYRAVVENVKNILGCYSISSEIPRVQKFGHMFLEWTKNSHCFYTWLKLRKLHRNFSHSSAGKLFNALKPTKPQEVVEGTIRILKDRSRRFEPCQRFSQPPVRFKVKIPTKDILACGGDLSADITLFI